MSKKRPYLHCMMVELIDDFFAEYPAATGELRTSNSGVAITAVSPFTLKLSSEGQDMTATLAEKKCTSCRGGVPPSELGIAR